MKKLGPYELVLDSPVEVAAWVDARIPDFAGQERSGGYQAIGLARRGRLIAGFLFHNMQPNRGSVEMTAAGLGAFLRPEVVAFLAWNAFELLGCAHLTARTAEDNLRARRALETVGFVLEGMQRTAWDGERNAVLYGLTKNDAQKWRRYQEG